MKGQKMKSTLKLRSFDGIFLLCAAGICTAIPVAVSSVREVITLFTDDRGPGFQLMLDGVYYGEKLLFIVAVVLAFMAVLFQKNTGAAILPVCAVWMYRSDILSSIPYVFAQNTVDTNSAGNFLQEIFRQHAAFTMVQSLFLIAGSIALLVVVFGKKEKMWLLIAAICFGIELGLYFSNALPDIPWADAVLTALAQPLYWMLAVLTALHYGSKQQVSA